MSKSPYGIARGPWKSKADGMNTRRHRWVCLSCNHDFDNKRKRCPICESKRLQYFPSTLEYNRFRVLQSHEKLGIICELQLQPRFPIYANGQKVTTYVADFSYRNPSTRELTVEDTKGVETDVWKLKAKLLKAVCGISVTVIKRA